MVRRAANITSPDTWFVIIDKASAMTVSRKSFTKAFAANVCDMSSLSPLASRTAGKSTA
jgi:hypothetical protein